MLWQRCGRDTGKTDRIPG